MLRLWPHTACVSKAWITSSACSLSWNMRKQANLRIITHKITTHLWGGDRMLTRELQQHKLIKQNLTKELLLHSERFILPVLWRVDPEWTTKRQHTSVLWWRLSPRVDFHLLMRNPPSCRTWASLTPGEEISGSRVRTITGVYCKHPLHGSCWLK